MTKCTCEGDDNQKIPVRKMPTSAPLAMIAQLSVTPWWGSWQCLLTQYRYAGICPAGHRVEYAQDGVLHSQHLHASFNDRQCASTHGSPPRRTGIINGRSCFHRTLTTTTTGFAILCCKKINIRTTMKNENPTIILENEHTEETEILGSEWQRPRIN